MDFVTMNPAFELHSAEWCLDARNIATNDNMVAINSAVSVDFAGQIAAESIGPRVISGAGGQTSFAIGSFLSKGGRIITVMPSTAGSGKSASPGLPRCLQRAQLSPYRVL